MRVVQFHPAISDGDAISNCMRDISALAITSGFESEIIVHHNDLQDTQVRLANSFSFRDSDILIIHHSLGTEGLNQITSTQCRKILWYHNITPPELLANEHLRSLSHLGRQQLNLLRQSTSAAITDSFYSARELRSLGYNKILVHPPGYSHLQITKEAKKTPKKNHESWLFIGRIARNKNQLGLVENFAKYKELNHDAKLVLVGGTSEPQYLEVLVDCIGQFGLTNDVTLLGKVSDELKHNLLRRADVYISASLHEGYGVPLIEAMQYDLPVVAYRCGAVAEIVMDAGLLVRSDEKYGLAEAVNSLDRDPKLCADLSFRRSEYLRYLEATLPARKSELVELLEASCLPTKTRIRVEGPFETSYSLAQLNRSLASAFDDRLNSQIALAGVEGFGLYTVDLEQLALLDKAIPVIEDRKQAAETVIRQTFPPRLDDVTGLHCFSYFGWEESVIPGHIVEHFNTYADGIGVMSNFVKEVCLRSGVSVPVEVVGVGVNPPSVSVSTSQVSSEFQFLSVSSGFPRKGIDLLLEAFFAEFGNDPTTRLILKTFPNIHNAVDDQLSYYKERFPRASVEHICEDLSPSEVHDLFAASNCYVHPSRGEGFGLGAAEAMLAGLPVIGSAVSGSADFLTEETAIVIPARRVQSDSHLKVPGSTWFEPDVVALAKAMREIRRGQVEGLGLKTDRARQIIEKKYSWEAVADRWEQFIERVQERKHSNSVTVVSPYSVGCGIAQYSYDLYSGFGRRYDVRFLAHHADLFLDDDVHSVRPCWPNGFDSNKEELLALIAEDTAEVLHIQHNFGFFSPSALEDLLRKSRHGRKVVTLHRTESLEIDDGRTVSIADYSRALNYADSIIVHSAEDCDRVQENCNLRDVRIIPIGVVPHAPPSQSEARTRLRIPQDSLVIGSVGFALPHKNIELLIYTCDALRKNGVDCRLILECSLHSDPISREYASLMKDLIKDLGLESSVYWNPDFTDLRTRIDRLAASTLVALCYLDSGESSSAALRTAAQSSRPIVVSHSEIFRDVRDVFTVINIDDGGVDLYSHALNLWLGDKLRDEAESRTAQFLEANNLHLVQRATEEVLFN